MQIFQLVAQDGGNGPKEGKCQGRGSIAFRVVTARANEVAQKREAYPIALFRVELDAPYAVLVYHRGEMNPIFRSSCNNPGIIGLSIVGVSEIEIRTVGYITQEWVPKGPPEQNYPIPSHVGDLHRIREPLDSALDEIEAAV